MRDINWKKWITNYQEIKAMNVDKVLSKIFLVFGKVYLLYNFVKKNAIKLQT